MVNNLGKHVFIDMHDIIHVELLKNKEKIEEYMLTAAKLAKANILHSYFHHFGNDYGVTGIVAVSESHLSIHTWPEYKSAIIDIFLCGELVTTPAEDYLLDKFMPLCYNVSYNYRGKLINERSNRN
jgi:S-adenosylmethionine decarboxylase